MLDYFLCSTIHDCNVLNELAFKIQFYLNLENIEILESIVSTEAVTNEDVLKK